MRKIAICDDEAIIRKQLLLFLKNMEPECGETFDVSCFSSAEDMLANLAEDTHILLLDIKMGGLSGIEAAKKIRNKNQSLCIIFITTMTQYALEGYEVHAFDFVTKPLQYEVFQRTILDALHTLTQRSGVALALKGKDEVIVYRSNAILYFEVYGRILNVVTQTEQREFVVPLKEVEHQVEGWVFFRCHKSFLINCQYVKRIGANSLLMADGRDIPLSKHRRNDFLTEFSRYVRGPL